MRVPLTLTHDPAQIVGYVEVDESRLPKTPDFVLSISYRPRDEQVSGKPNYVLLDVGVLSHVEYEAYLVEKRCHA